MQSASRQLPLFTAADDEPDPVSGFSVRVSSRAKRLSIKVFPRGKVEVVVPRRARSKEVRDFVEANREWIDNARRSFAADHAPEPFALPEAIHLRTIDQVVPVRYRQEQDCKSVRYRLSGGVLTLSGCTGDDKLCVGALRRCLACTHR